MYSVRTGAKLGIFSYAHWITFLGPLFYKIKFIMIYKSALILNIYVQYNFIREFALGLN